MKAKIIIENKYGTHSVELENKNDDLNIFDMWDDILKPLLLAIGYQEGSINELMESKNE